MQEISNAICAHDPYEKIALELQLRGWSVVSDFLSATSITALREELLTLRRDGEFREAGVGRGKERIVDKSIRNDEVKWLSSDTGTDAQIEYWQAMERLRVTLNRQLYLGLESFEAHMTLYKAGSYYRRHVDQFRGAGLREVTAILYLNENWQQSEGGELLIYSDAQASIPLHTIYPLGGQLVVFLSADFPHEVLPATRQRLSMTGWFKKRPMGTHS